MQPSYFRGERDFRIAYQVDRPEPFHANVLIVHGSAEHRGRYRHVVQALVNAGFQVYSFDHRGHGESDGIKGDVEHFGYFVEDLKQMVGIIKEKDPEQPLFLVAHSLGGLISLHFLWNHQSIVSGAVLMSPALDIGSDVSPALKANAAWVARLFPLWPIAPANRQKESVLSRDPSVQEAFDRDPLCYTGKVRARYGHELLKAGEFFQTRGRSITLPLLIQYGTADKLVHPGPTRDFFERVGSLDKTLKAWEGARHELFNELEKDQAIETVVQWLKGHV